MNPPVYPASQLQKRFHSFDQSGRFTSACSGMIYRDELLFPRHAARQHAFTCEPFHNLVQHNIILDNGVSFTFERDPAESETDFFASEDRWCRPVMTRTGPDGGLWVVDMYRYMIEHPEWLPQEGKDELRPYYRLGEGRGRIYRIVPEVTGEVADSARSTLGLPGNDPQPATIRLVEALESPNGWQRDFAQRELVRRNDPAAIDALQKLAAAGRSPLARLHALATLDGLNQLSSEQLRVGLSDEHSGVRRWAVRLAAGFPDEVNSLVELVNDADAKVRLQLAATLGDIDDSTAADLLARLAADSADDPYIIANVMSSLSGRNVSRVLSRYVTHLSDAADARPSQWSLQSQLMSQVIALGNTDTIEQIVDLVCREQGLATQQRFAGLADLLDALARREIQWTALTPSARKPSRSGD